MIKSSSDHCGEDKENIPPQHGVVDDKKCTPFAYGHKYKGVVIPQKVFSDNVDQFAAKPDTKLSIAHQMLLEAGLTEPTILNETITAIKPNFRSRIEMPSMQFNYVRDVQIAAENTFHSYLGPDMGKPEAVPVEMSSTILFEKPATLNEDPAKLHQLNRWEAEKTVEIETSNASVALKAPTSHTQTESSTDAVEVPASEKHSDHNPIPSGAVSPTTLQLLPQHQSTPIKFLKIERIVNSMNVKPTTTPRKNIVAAGKLTTQRGNVAKASLPMNWAMAALPMNGATASLPMNGAMAALPMNAATASLPINEAKASLQVNGANTALQMNEAKAAPQMIGTKAALKMNGAKAALQMNGATSSLPINEAKASLQVNVANTALKMNGAKAALQMNRAKAALQMNGAKTSYIQVPRAKLTPKQTKTIRKNNAATETYIPTSTSIHMVDDSRATPIHIPNGSKRISTPTIANRPLKRKIDENIGRIIPAKFRRVERTDRVGTTEITKTLPEITMTYFDADGYAKRIFNGINVSYDNQTKSPNLSYLECLKLLQRNNCSIYKVPIKPSSDEAFKNKKKTFAVTNLQIKPLNKK